MDSLMLKLINIGMGGRYGKKDQKKKRDRYRADDLRTLCEVRRARREAARAWMGNTLNDLVETRQRTASCGPGDHYFRLSIQKLCELKGVAVVPARFRDKARRGGHIPRAL